MLKRFLVLAALVFVPSGVSAAVLSPIQEVPSGPAAADVTFDPHADGGYTYDGQPETFDPATAKLQKNDGHSWLGELGPIVVNGQQTDGDYPVKLSAPFSLTYYTFLNADASYVLEFKKNGKRHALYTHVFFWRVSPDGKQLFLINAVKQNGTWKRMQRIIQLDTKSYVQLPFDACTQYEMSAIWSSQSLLTQGVKQGVRRICVWSSGGKAVEQFTYVTPPDIDDPGPILLPLQREPAAFAIETTNAAETECGILLQRLRGNQQRFITIYKTNDGCAAQTEYDLGKLRWNKSTLRYRIFMGGNWTKWLTIKER